MFLVCLLAYYESSFQEATANLVGDYLIQNTVTDKMIFKFVIRRESNSLFIPSIPLFVEDENGNFFYYKKATEFFFTFYSLILNFSASY